MFTRTGVKQFAATVCGAVLLLACLFAINHFVTHNVEPERKGPHFNERYLRIVTQITTYSDNGEKKVSYTEPGYATLANANTSVQTDAVREVFFEGSPEYGEAVRRLATHKDLLDARKPISRQSYIEYVFHYQKKKIAPPEPPQLANVKE
jgi:hypothetical protein